MNENYLKELGDQIALAHWAQSNEKTYEEICDRVVNYMCDDPSEEGRNYNRRMKDLLKSKKFIPNSPCWINAGTDMKNLFACYVIDLQDNMSSIMDTAKRMAMIMKEGGGVGVSLTPIRAEGSRVGPEGSKRTASGPVSFLKVFDAVTGAVKAAGVRRGAALANLKTGHPDIIKFIRCKEDQNQINNFNLSVAITDEFMDDVINGSDKIWAEEEDIKYTASDIYDMIVEHMWRNGEPGVQFIDTVNNVDGKYTGRPEFREFNTGIEVSNPCVTGDTLILTDKGYFPIKDLVGKRINIWNGFEWSEVEPRKTGEDQKLLKVTFSNGAEVRCTPYHKFVVQPVGKYFKLLSSVKTEAKDLRLGDRLIKCNWPVIEGSEELDNAYTQGFFSGDGSYYYGRPTISFYGEKIKLISGCAVFSDHKKALKSFNLGKVKRVCCRVNVPFSDKSFVPDSSYNIKSRLEWLAGLCDSDGSLNSREGAITISSVDRNFLNKVNLMLNTMGVMGVVSLMKKATEKYMPDGKGGLKLYNCKDCYRITISGSNIESLKALGFRTRRVKLVNTSVNRNANRFVMVTSISACKEHEDVYCLTEPKNHTMIVNGVISSQCGESFLKPNEACNLGSINLYHFVHPFWKGEDKKADMALRQELKQTVEDAVDFLNLMIDKSETPFEEVNAAVRASRKTGLGVMGLADYLSAKGITYGSPEAVHEAADVFAFITKTAEEYSLRKGYKNACLTIQAPTGTTGLVGEVSTGIEPHFLRCWTRHSLKMGDLLMYPKSLRDYIENFCDDDCGYQDEINQAIMLRENMKNNNFEEFSKLLESENNVAREIRKFWPTAHEVTPKQHLAMLAAIQRHVHNSVSKTINLPHDATVDDVRELITTAWRSGCKGFTCYRDGSRDSQPLKAVEDTNNNIGSVFTDKLGQSLLIQDTGDNLVDSLEHCNIRCDVGNVEFVLKPVAGMEEVKATALDSDKEILEKVKSGEWRVVECDRFDTLVEMAALAKEQEKLEFDVGQANELIKSIRSGKLVLVPGEEYRKTEEILEKVKRFEDDVAKLPPEYFPKNSVKDFAKDMDVPNKNVPCKRPRPETTYGETVKTRIGCGTMYITVNSDDNGICEVFTSLGRNGGCPSQSEATSRLISLALRSGVSVEAVIDQLKGIRCMNTMRKGGVKQTDGTVVLSCPDAIGKIMEKVSKDKKSEGLYIQSMRDATSEERDSVQSHLMDIGKDTGLDFYSIIKNAEIKVDDGDKSIKTRTVLLNGQMVCPECGEELKRDGGCIICRHCGYSKCG